MTTSDTDAMRVAEKRFWPKIDKQESCWQWKAHIMNRGYGQFYFGGKLVLAHRFSYELAKGKIEDGLVIDHLCRNRACVNPEHLRATTISENVLCGVGKSAQNKKKTHCLNGHEFTGDNIIEDTGKYGSAHRECRTCHNQRSKEYRSRKRQAALASIDVEKVADALTLAAKTFRHYEELHRAKPDDVKADKNAMLAA